MRSLLDVNVLIANLDSDHTLHQRASGWFSEHAHHGWATCPLTQNGCVRIMCGQGYKRPLPAQQIIKRLADACAEKWHEFWPDDISLLNSSLVDASRVHGPRQLTDIYLLALAVKHGGRLVTLDSTVALSAVHGAKPQHLLNL
jgi:toxin-antitoxin system PIN domain toxin